MPPSPQAQSLDNVRQRYGTGAKAQVPELCCPVDYDASLLKVLPDEILERDYGCGDPSQFVRSGDVVLDLGAGGGKICYMASQIVGPEGRVIGVDATPEMLDPVDTAVSTEKLREVGLPITAEPEAFALNPKIQRLIRQRREMIDGERPVDWGMAETLAYGTLLVENIPVRLSGQDVRLTILHPSDIHSRLIEYDFDPS